MRLRVLLERHPIISAILVAPAMWALILAGGAVFALIAQIYPVEMPALRQAFITAVPPLVFYLVLRRLGWASMVGFNGPTKWRDVHLFWLPALLIPASLSNLLLREIVWSRAGSSRRGSAGLAPWPDRRR